MGIGNRTNEYGQVSDKPSEGNFREQFPDTTSTGKKENSKKTRRQFKKKVLSYPLARNNESPADYLQIEIAEYQAAGLKLPAFEKDTKKDSPEDAFRVKPNQDNVFELNRGSQANDFGNNRKNKFIKHIINLPMPRNVTDSQGVQYGEASLNPIEAFGLSALQGSITSTPSISGLKQTFTNVIGAAGEGLTNPNTQQAVAAALSGQAIGALGGNVNANQVLARASGQILNPNLELLFNGVGLRTFPLSFQFFPRNRQEGDVVLNIIRTLKFEMAPTRKSDGNLGVFIGSPSIFQLTYKTGKEDHRFLNRFLPAVLSDMKVNYSASGAHSTFHNGTPTHMQVDMQFKELNPIFREDYADVAGVGY